MNEKFERLGNLYRPPLFDGTNFPYWKVSMVAFIEGTLGDDVWDAIEKGYTFPTKPAAEGSTERIRKLLTEYAKEEKQISLSNKKRQKCNIHVHK